MYVLWADHPSKVSYTHHLPQSHFFGNENIEDLLS